MTIAKLKEVLDKVVEEGKATPDTQVCFRHCVKDYNDPYYSSVDYILTHQKPGSIVLCYDDGHF